MKYFHIKTLIMHELKKENFFRQFLVLKDEGKKVGNYF